MNRQERNQYNRMDYDDDRNTGYSSDDRHYHHARNLTNEFEQEYSMHHRGDHDHYERDRSYNQGSSRNEGSMGGNRSMMGNAYDQYRREEGGFRNQSDNDWNDRGRSNYASNYSQNQDRSRNYQNEYSRNQGSNRGWDSDQDTSRQERRGDIRQGYGISDFEGTSDRYNTLNSDSNRWSDNDRDSYSGSRGSSNRSRFSGSMGEASTHSDRGIPNYASRSSSNDYSAGSGYTSGRRGSMQDDY